MQLGGEGYTATAVALPSPFPSHVPSPFPLRPPVVAQLAVGKRVMASGKSFSIASDGVKIGKPKKETVAYLAVNHDKGRAQWLAPQEPGPAGLQPPSHPSGVTAAAVELTKCTLTEKGRR